MQTAPCDSLGPGGLGSQKGEGIVCLPNKETRRRQLRDKRRVSTYHSFVLLCDQSHTFLTAAIESRVIVCCSLRVAQCVVLQLEVEEVCVCLSTEYAVTTLCLRGAPLFSHHSLPRRSANPLRPRVRAFCTATQSQGPLLAILCFSYEESSLSSFLPDHAALQIIVPSVRNLRRL